MCITAAILGSAAIGAVGANKASKAQSGAAKDDLALKERIYEESVGRLSPYTDAGNNALMAYMQELGFTPAGGGSGGTGGVEDMMGRLAGVPWGTGNRQSSGYGGYSGISLSPAAQFAMTQGRDTIESGAASRGGLFSGAAMKGLEGFRMGLATQDRDNQLNRLFDLMRVGQSSATGQNTAGQNFSVGAGNAYGAMGNARSAGAVGVTNSINDAMGQYIGYNAYNNALTKMYPGQA